MSLSTSERVPVSPSRRKPRSTAWLATTSAMLSQGSGDLGSTSASAWWMVLSGQIRKSAPVLASLCADESISSADAQPVTAVDALHVLGERVRMHRDLGMIVLTEQVCALHADSAVTQRCAFGGAGDDPDVLRHVVTFGRQATAQSRLGITRRVRRKDGNEPRERALVSCGPRHRVLLSHRGAGSSPIVIIRLIHVAGATSHPPDGDSTARASSRPCVPTVIAFDAYMRSR